MSPDQAHSLEKQQRVTVPCQSEGDGGGLTVKQRRRASVGRATCAVSTGAVEPDRATRESRTPDSRSQLVTAWLPCSVLQGREGAWLEKGRLDPLDVQVLPVN